MLKKWAIITVLVNSLAVVLLLGSGKIIRGQEAPGQVYLPVTMNVKALVPYQVKDINTQTPSSFIFCPEALGQRMLCSAKDAAHGYELWSSNGKAGGASLLKDIEPGGDSYALHPDSSWAKLNDLVIFTAGDFEPGLWRSDGTKSGTWLVRGFRSLGGEEPFTAASDRLYFQADDGQHGHELWFSDGSTSGTKLLKDIWPGVESRGIYSLTPVGPKLYFIVEGDDYYTLWVSDGSAGGTKQVAVVAHAVVTKIAAFGDLLIMDMIDLPDAHSSLWRTDGTDAGTLLISDYGAQQGLNMIDLATLDGGVVFTFTAPGTGGWGIGRSDGTSEGTSLAVKNKVQGRAPLDLIPAGSQAFFFEERYPEEKQGLWRTDGTAMGTLLLGRFKPPDHICRSRYVVDGISLAFAADDGEHGCELWISDGTPQGTRMVADIAAGAKSSWPLPGVRFKQQLYFSATDSLGDAELWRTDGTAAGTERADDVIDSPSASSFPSHLIAQPDGIYLAARTGTERGLWRSDGSQGGTTLVKSFGSDAFDNPLHAADWAMIGETLYLITQRPSAVWRSDGSESGTVALSGPVECDLPSRLAVVGDKLLFFAEARGSMLCQAGSPHEKIKYLQDSLYDALAAERLLYFRLTSGQIGVSDGTAAGTKIYPAPRVTLGPNFKMAAVGDTVFFNGCAASGQDCELWQLAGPQAAPQRVADIVPGAAGSNPVGLVAFEEGVIFSAASATFGPLLWRSDGTAVGTLPLAPVAQCGLELPAVVVGGQLFFAGLENVQGIESPYGCELWATDGTFAGTRQVLDIWPGPASSTPGALTDAGGALFFTANDGRHGCDLWTSDGRSAGTFRIPGEGLNRCPEQMTVSRGRLYFDDDGRDGDFELWAMLTGAGMGR